MIKRLKDSKSRGSLRHQIRLAARQLADDRQAVNLHWAALGERLQAGLTSPDMLLFAAGTGFVIAEFTDRADSSRDSKGPRTSRRATIAGAGKALRRAIEMYGFAHAATTAMGAEPHHLHKRTHLPSA